MGNKNRVTIPNGYVGLIEDTQRGNYYFVGQGQYTWENPYIRFMDGYSIYNLEDSKTLREIDKLPTINDPRIKRTQNQIAFGSKAIVFIKNGELGFIKDSEEGNYYALAQGLHYWTNPNYQLETVISLNSRENKARENNIGPYTLLTVRQGEKALTYNGGHIEALDEGWWILPHRNHVFQQFISTGKISEDISKAGMSSKHVPEGMFVEAKTSDGVPISMGASITYSIGDVEKAVQNYFTEDSKKGVIESIHENLKLRARRVICQCVQQCKYSSLEAIQIMPKKEDVQEMLDHFRQNEGQYKGLPRDLRKKRSEHEYSHDDYENYDYNRTYNVVEFIKQMEDNGILIEDFNVMGYECLDENVRTEMANRATTLTKAQNKRKEAEGTRDADIIEAEGKKKAEIIKAEGKSAKTTIEAEANSKKTHIEADAGAYKKQQETAAEVNRRRQLAKVDLENAKHYNEAEKLFPVYRQTRLTEAQGKIMEAARGMKPFLFFGENNDMSGFCKAVTANIAVNNRNKQYSPEECSDSEKLNEGVKNIP